MLYGTHVYDNAVHVHHTQALIDCINVREKCALIFSIVLRNNYTNVKKNNNDSIQLYTLWYLSVMLHFRPVELPSAPW